jgi:hypothetical protein
VGNLNNGAKEDNTTNNIPTTEVETQQVGHRDQNNEHMDQNNK